MSTLTKEQQEAIRGGIDALVTLMDVGVHVPGVHSNADLASLKKMEVHIRVLGEMLGWHKEPATMVLTDPLIECIKKSPNSR